MQAKVRDDNRNERTLIEDLTQLQKIVSNFIALAELFEESPPSNLTDVIDEKKRLGELLHNTHKHITGHLSKKKRKFQHEILNIQIHIHELTSSVLLGSKFKHNDFLSLTQKISKSDHGFFEFLLKDKRKDFLAGLSLLQEWNATLKLKTKDLAKKVATSN